MYMDPLSLYNLTLFASCCCYTEIFSQLSEDMNYKFLVLVLLFLLLFYFDLLFESISPIGVFSQMFANSEQIF